MKNIDEKIFLSVLNLQNFLYHPNFYLTVIELNNVYSITLY